MCASDSVAALTMIDKIKYSKIYSILFGEGLINDAVSIILFKSISYVVPSKDKIVLNEIIALRIIGNFFYISLISFILGLIIGAFHSFVLKNLRHISHKSHFEIGLIFFFGLMIYFAAECLHLSGIISNNI